MKSLLSLPKTCGLAVIMLLLTAVTASASRMVYVPNEDEEEIDDTWYLVAQISDSEPATFPMSFVGSLVAIDDAATFSILDTDGDVLAENVFKITFKPKEQPIATDISTPETKTNLLGSMVNDKLTLIGVNSDVTLYDANGKQMLQQEAQGGETVINIGHLPSGVYIVKCGKQTFKFIKK